MPDELSIVIPVFNERDNLPILKNRIVAAMSKLKVENWEAILINDGSNDGSGEIIDNIAQDNDRFRTIHLDKNCGQSAAIEAGFKHARFAVIGTLDADLQNDPFDYGLLFNSLKEEIGVVCGIRVKRNDTLSKRLASRFANWFRNKMTHETVTDTGCSLKLFRKEAVEKLKLFDGMHRFLPTLIRMEGFAIAEVPVGHHARYSGTSKYNNLKRGWRGFFDLLAIRWMQKRHLNYHVLTPASKTISPLKQRHGGTETGTH